MRKSYYYNGRVYDFTDIHEVRGMLHGKCTTPRPGKWAWLDHDGFQFHGERRIQAEPRNPEVPMPVDNSYTMWGGELRDKLPHGARYYQRGRRW